MDLNLLPHLSDDALREEAARHGLPTGGSRDALIAAIRAHSKPTSEPPNEPTRSEPTTGEPTTGEPTTGEPTTGEPTTGEPTTDQPRPGSESGMLGSARALFGRVVGLAKSALDRNPREEAAEAPRTREPIRTRTMAELLIEQGHLDRGIEILRGLAPTQPEAEARLAEVEAQRSRARLEEAAAEASPKGVELIGEKDRVAVAWSIEAAGLERARALLGSEGELTLRVVAIWPDPELAVRNRTTDHPLQLRRTQGWQILDAPAGARVIASVGLLDGDRFVSIAHAKR